ncbi:arginine--tRNA ligase [Flavobacterium sp. ASW18X]|uniref:arginine--tRNA ligase n=1 Tax=Flavobacterium sp. ASW18X TaxID=2572595 RepID=UPI0010AED70D|nr:arginine--tRNA ligase [Flavobacterium sp. ASW18X]TKD61851.1 arginine--tRNA ligase [Flavobacterium sp. ASW18X]
MKLTTVLEEKVKEAVQSIFGQELPAVEFQPTRKDFEGDITVVVFPMLRVVKGNPVAIGTQIGEYLVENVEEVAKFNVVKGFLNLVVSDAYYINFFKSILVVEQFGYAPANSKDAVMVEYSSPNTNKPLHLGHIRNNLLGYSVAEILKAAGHKVYKTQIINDRGIHICKSMLAWQKFGKDETPDSSGLKGDHLVGKYYVAFDKAYKAEIAELISAGKTKEEAEKEAPILLEAQEMLRKWEAGDAQVVELWKMMNGWVYKGFDTTYENLGVDFNQLYYESDTYLLGRDVVQDGLEKGVFFKKEDGSVWIDLTEDGLDEKIVLRSDGTAVYMTQDIGTAIQRVTDFPDINGMVYTVGNEQDYHFKVLFLILKKLGYSWADKLYHLSYGMVDLPSGKMKSREGTVVDADDLIQNMEDTAAEISQELGKLDGYSDTEKQALYRTIGLGALKYYILKVDPKKRILFNPEESVDFQGNTGPFIQYTYARIQSILRKANELNLDLEVAVTSVHPKEKELLKQLELFPDKVQEAAENHSPALVANYVYDLVKEFNSFYQQVSILGEEDAQIKAFRVNLSKKVADVIKDAFLLLGIHVPVRM